MVLLSILAPFAFGAAAAAFSLVLAENVLGFTDDNWQWWGITFGLTAFLIIGSVAL